VLTADPVADIRVLQGGRHLAMLIKDGKIVDLDGQKTQQDLLAFVQEGVRGVTTADREEAEALLAGSA
jgi:hypothetical protein